jgi:hypothetical protein
VSDLAGNPDGVGRRAGRGATSLALVAAALAMLALAAGVHRGESDPPPLNAVARVEVARCPGNPLVVRDQDPRVGDDVNGPSVLRVPDWVERPLGRYYLYFAHHHGKSIRLATADAPCGPWTVRDPVLALADLPWIKHHVASPDVHVDDARREIVMYVHGRRLDDGQETVLTVSRDGRAFEGVRAGMAPPYLRRFDWRGAAFAVTAGGLRATPSGPGYHAALARSPDGRAPFARVKTLAPRVRHTAVLRRGDAALVFFSRFGDAPERILVSSLALGDDPRRWRMSAPREVLRPERPWEGGDAPLRASERGGVREVVAELRDPAILEDEGRTWLFYSIAGESGLAAAEIEVELRDAPGVRLPGAD